MPGIIWQKRKSIKIIYIMKKLQGMKSGFSSLENKKLSNLANINGGLIIGETNIRTTSETGPNGKPGNTGDTQVCNDGKHVATITLD
jgi:hypothetical protein